MDNEKLKQGNILQSNIEDFKNEIRRVENCHGLNSVCFMYGRDSSWIVNDFVNFPALKKQILASMKRKLSELEKEFGKL